MLISVLILIFNSQFPIMKARQIGRLLKDAGIKFWTDEGPRLSAAMTFYLVLSLYPLILTTVVIAGFAFGQDAAKGELVAQLRGTVGRDGAVVLAQLLKQSTYTYHGPWSAVVVLAMFLVSASGLFSSLQGALNTIWQVPGKKPGGGIMAMVKERLLTFVLVWLTAILLLLSLVATAILTSLNAEVGGFLPASAELIEAANIALSFILTATMFAAIFKWLPNADLAWSDVWLGAILTAVLTALGRYPIGLYLNSLSYVSAFGAAEALVVFLVWVYYTTWLFLYGAEFTFLYATRPR